MKLLDLRLLAYGPFTDVKLDFSSRPLGLHVIYGQNEAGKSTTLRAVRGLLYGIEDKTQDAHVHKYADLRIGARLADADGTEIELVRRKGRKDTLLDPAGRPVDELVMQRLLRSVSAEVFGTLFGLDHEALRRGGEALLRGGGAVGESLFEAGLGAGGLHDVLESLAAEAEALFTPQAQKKPLNEALRSFAEAQKRARDAALHSDAWTRQEQDLADSRARLGEVEGELKALKKDESRLRRAKNALPLFARRRALAEARRALGEVVLLDERAPAEREAAVGALENAREALDKLDRELAELEPALAAIVVPEALLADEAALELLRERRVLAGKAALELPHLRGQLEGAESEAQKAARRLGQGAQLELAGVSQVDAASQAAIRKLAREEETVRREALRTRTARAALEARLARERARLAQLPEPRETARAKAQLQRAQRQGDLPGRVRRSRAERARLDENVRARLAALGRFSGTLEAAVALPLPTAQAVEAHVDAARALERRREKLEEKRAEAQDLARRLDVEIETLRRAGDVPSEERLEDARARRGALWAALRAGFTVERAEAFEAQVARADELADRLRHEAHEVAQLLRLRLEREQLDGVLRGLQAESARLEAERAQAGAAFRSLWPPALDVGAPAEMRGFVERHALLVTAAEARARAEAEGQALEAEEAALEAELGQLLAELGAPPDAASGLALRLDEAAARLEAAEAQAAERRRLADTVAQLEHELGVLCREEEQAAEALAAWHEAFRVRVGAIGLGPSASGEEAIAVLDLSSEVGRKLEEASRLSRRIREIEDKDRELGEQVAQLAAAHAPALRALPPAEAADELLRRAAQGREDALARKGLQQQLRERREARAEHEERRRKAERRLHELLAHAGVGGAGGERAVDRTPDRTPDRTLDRATLAALERAEARSAEARELDRRLRELDDQLLGLAEGAPLEALEAELAGRDADELAAELESLEQRAEELAEERDRLNRQIGSNEAGRPELELTERAQEAAAEAQAHLARARRHAERWLRVRAAGVLLARQIEAYREQNQGPLVTRASELFARLTIARYRGLKAAFDERDQAVLKAVRSDGAEVAVEQLSDGTRDQLYLALRLASLERHALSHEPLPLVVDDILIHFDDQRARAGLEVLSELTDRMQVLFFTHHARLVELARAAVPPERLREHQLP